MDVGKNWSKFFALRYIFPKSESFLASTQKKSGLNCKIYKKQPKILT